MEVIEERDLIEGEELKGVFPPYKTRGEGGREGKEGGQCYLK